MERYKIEQLCVLDSVYSLFVYLIMFSDKIDNTFFFVSKGIAKSIQEQLPNVKYIPVPSTNRYFLFFFHIYIYLYLWCYAKYKRIPKNIPTYGSDFLRWSDFFVSNTTKYNLIEDGLSNYCSVQKFQKKYNSSFFYRLLVNRTPMFTLPYGLSENVKTIYLTGMADFPEVITHKIKKIDIQNLWKDLSDEAKERILGIYVRDKKIIKNLLSTSRKILLLTQCYSEDGVCTEKAKIDKYREILAPYSIEDVIIKKHPREKTDYTKVFSSALVLNDPIPFEILNILGLKLEKVITYNSSAVYCLPDNVEKIITRDLEHDLSTSPFE